jgi:hypothetical protein
MAATIRLVTLVGLLLFVAGCRDARDFKLPSAPTSVTTPLQTHEPAPPPPTSMPLIGQSATYVFSAPLSYPVGYFTVGSRYVVYENGAFVFSYDNLSVSYVGSYTRENEHLSLGFGSKGAVATLVGDLLEVRYDDLLQQSDFENAVYKRSQ